MNISHELVVWLLFASCKGAVVGVLVLCARRLFAERLSAQVNVFAWLAVIAAFIVPVGWQVRLPASAGREFAPPTIALGAEIESTITEPSSTPADIAKTQDGISAVAVTDLVVMVWLAGVLALSSLLIANHLRFVRIRRAAQRVDIETECLFDHCRAEMQIARKVRLLQSSAIQAPTLFGLWSPTLLLPQNVGAQLDREALRHVLLHELAHVERWDLLTRWITAFAQVLHWFNPLVWVIGERLRNDLEVACDARVLSVLAGRERAAYGHTLIQVAEMPASRRFGVQVGMSASHEQLKARIQMINQFKSQRKQSLFAGLMLALTAPFAFAQWGGLSAAAVTPTAQRQEGFVPVAKDNSSITAQPTATPERKPASSSSTRTQVEYFKIKYIDAADLKVLIQSGSGIALLSPRGHVAVDSRTNTLLVNDTEERLAAVRELVAKIDVPLRRVLFEARIAIVDGEASRELLARNPPTPSGDPSPVQSPLKVMTAGYRPDAELAAIQSARKGEVISAPTLITANRQEAKIEQGIELPSAERMVLTVTSRPVITPDGRIQVFLTLRRESDKPGPVTGGSDARPDVRQISTQALINDGQTLVLSGLMPPATSSNAQDTKSNKQDLLVFLTSRIVAEDASRNF